MKIKVRYIVVLSVIVSLIIQQAMAVSKEVSPSAVTPGYGGGDSGFLWKGPVVVSPGSHATEALFLTGSYPIQGDGYDPEQLLIVTSVTSVDNEPLCHFSTCYFVKDKWITLRVTNKPRQAQTFVKFYLVEKLSNQGSHTPSNYQYVEATVSFIKSVVLSLIPGGGLVESAIQLMKDLSSSTLYTQVSGMDSISEQLAPATTAGAMFEVTVLNRNSLPGGTFYYIIEASSKVKIYSDTHFGWLTSPRLPQTYNDREKKIEGITSYEEGIQTRTSYTLKVVINR